MTAPRLYGRFVDDITIPDDTPMTFGQGFTKTWLAQNTGKQAWKPGYKLVFAGGERMSAQTSIPLPLAGPGQHVEISLQMVAPGKAGKHFCDWQFQDDQGKPFGEFLYARIVSMPPAPVVNVPVNNSYFVADVTVPDGSTIEPGVMFTKTWRVKNSGRQAWGPGYFLSFTGGTPMTGSLNVPIPTTPPGSEANLSLDLKAPELPGTYSGDWKLKDSNGQPFGAKYWLQITVPGQAPRPISPNAAPIGQQTAPSVPVPPTAPAPVPTPSGTQVPHFSQRDARWSNIPLANMGGAPSIGRWGCQLTCLAMLANVFGYTTTPDQLNRDMVTRGGFMNGYFTRWDGLSKVYPDITFEAKVDGAIAISRIDISLQAGRPVPVLVDLTPSTAYSDIDQHWVLVVARSGEDYYVNDPSNLTPGVTSLMARYGKPGGGLAEAVRSGLLYRR